MGNKKFIKNTVAGKRRGSKWPPEVKTACMCEMLLENNLHVVARRNGVPESTLRTWYNEAKSKKGSEKQSLWDAARQAQVQAIAYNAAASARLTGEMIGRRLAAGDKNAKRCEEIREQLINEIAGEDNEKVTELRAELTLRPEIGDYPMANYMRALTSVADKAHVQQKGVVQPVVEVILEGEAKLLAK